MYSAPATPDLRRQQSSRSRQRGGLAFTPQSTNVTFYDWSVPIRLHQPFVTTGKNGFPQRKHASEDRLRQMYLNTDTVGGMVVQQHMEADRALRRRYTYLESRSGTPAVQSAPPSTAENRRTKHNPSYFSTNPAPRHHSNRLNASIDSDEGGTVARTTPDLWELSVGPGEETSPMSSPRCRDNSMTAVTRPHTCAPPRPRRVTSIVKPDIDGLSIRKGVTIVKKMMVPRSGSNSSEVRMHSQVNVYLPQADQPKLGKVETEEGGTAAVT